MTVQCRAIIEVIQSASEHPDAAALLDLAREPEPSIDRATVYRTIELLKCLRLIDELDLMHLQGENIVTKLSPGGIMCTWHASAAAGLKTIRRRFSSS